jgi:hypothetical protein
MRSNLNLIPFNDNPNQPIDSYYVEASFMSVPKNYINEYVDIINRFDEYYDKGYPYAHDHMPFAHLKESGLIENTKQYPTNIFYWELIRSECGSIRHKLN